MWQKRLRNYKNVLVHCFPKLKLFHLSSSSGHEFEMSAQIGAVTLNNSFNKVDVPPEDPRFTHDTCRI